MLNDDEKREFKELADSSALRQDMRKLSERRHNPFVRDGKVDIDKLLIFLTEYNSFISHTLRPFSKIIEKDMRL